MVATTTATAGTAAAAGAASGAAAAGTTAGVAATTGAAATSASAITAAGAGTAAGVAGGATTAGAAGTAATAGFGSWLHSALFGTAASGSSAGAGAGAGTAAGTAGASAGTAGTAGATGAGTGTAATSGLIGSGGEFSTKSLIANAMTGASATSAVMSGVSMGRQMKAAEKQAEIQYGQEKLKATQKSNLIRETILKDVASARAAYSSRGVLANTGSPAQVVAEGANQANQDIGVAQTDAKLSGLQLKAQGKQYGRSAPFSLLSGVGNAANIVGQRIISK